MLPSQEAVKNQSILSSYPADIQDQAIKITRKLIVLGFPATFTRMIEGPVVRTFYFQPTEFSKFSSIFSKAEEIAGTLSVESVRIERQLGECTISVPRSDRQTIRFDDCLHKMMISPITAEMQLPLLMGQSTDGEHLYADLANQPHLLIAGATNSGKSVYTSQLICSLSLFRSEDELEFILVDTKNLDLVLFRGLSHVKYILSDINDIRAALKELLETVRLRNEQMSGLARNIREWNKLQDIHADSIWAPGFEKVKKYERSQKMQYKVLIMDELADVLDIDNALLSQMDSKMRPPSIQSLLKQLAQISRAAGVHLILATQRPSVKILSGDIKANFPARVCFKLPSGFDSRVVLDENGAENLLGLGDYLYKIAGTDTVKRAHSAFVSMNDIATIIEQNEMIRKQYQGV
jgi:DNA segregation ATPase FtsK/SpoIIIE, S-DNA-T family